VQQILLKNAYIKLFSLKGLLRMQRFKLPANLAIRARDRIAKAYKQRRDKLLKFTRLSMGLDELVSFLNSYLKSLNQSLELK